MKQLWTSILLLLLTTACDGPQRNRIASTMSTGNDLGQPTKTSSNPWTTGSTTGSSSGTNGGSSGKSNRPAGFDSCDITAKHFAAGINYMGICQSTIDETNIAVNSTVTDSARTCIIPTYKEDSGSSTYIGIPQCFAPEAGIVTTGQLPKSRGGYYRPNLKFTDLPINAVMVIKEASKDAYFECMQAFYNFRSNQCPQGPTNNYCVQQANIYMAGICNSFKSNHPYIDIRLRNISI